MGTWVGEGLLLTTFVGVAGGFLAGRGTEAADARCWGAVGVGAGLPAMGAPPTAGAASRASPLLQALDGVEGSDHILPMHLSVIALSAGADGIYSPIS